MNFIRRAGISLLLSIWFFHAQSQSVTLKQAERAYDVLSYAEAIPLFENVLKDVKISDPDKLNAQLKLAFSYKQTRDSQNAERVYRNVLDTHPELRGEQSKAYLYYAQALASNSKYQESRTIYEKYQKSISDEPQAAATSKLYQDVSILTKNAGSYRIDYLNINTTYPDFSPMYYKNGIVFCSARNDAVGIKRIFSWNRTSFLDLYYLPDLSKVTSTATKVSGIETPIPRRTGSDDWQTPITSNDTKIVGFMGSSALTTGQDGAKPMESNRFSKALNTKYHEGPCAFVHDGSAVFLTRNNFNDGQFKESSDKINKIKMFTSPMQNGDWGATTEVPFNSNEYSTGHPAISPDDKWVYFISDMPGGFGGTDLYVVSYNKGIWGKPVNLGVSVNTKGNEMFPFVDEKGNLYFSSNGLPGLGDLDIFYVTLKDQKPVGKPINLGEPLNSPQDDFGIITDGLRKKGYFSSNRKRGGADDDIYQFTREGMLYPCRQMTLVAYNGETRMPLAGATITTETKKGKADIKITDEQGEATICLDANQQYTFKITKDGFLNNMVGYANQGDMDNEPSRMEIPMNKFKEILQQEVLLDTARVRANQPTKMTIPIDEISKPKPQKPVTLTQTGSQMPTSPKNEIVTKTKKTSMLVGHAKDDDDNPLAGVVMTFRSLCDSSIQSYLTEADGRYEFEMTDGCDFELSSEKEGYGRSTEIVKTLKTPDNAVKKPRMVAKDISLFKSGATVTSDNIYYPKSNADFPPGVLNSMERFVAILQKYPKMGIELGFYTDSRGITKANQLLTDKRAKAAIDYFVSRGIAKDRLIARGYGESQIVNQCRDGIKCTETEHQQNRRITVKIVNGK